MTFFHRLEVSETFYLGLKGAGVALVLALVCHYVAVKPPPASEILPAVLTEPEQVNLSAQGPFPSIVKGFAYNLYPKADYVLRGMVVSLHDSSFMDITHEAANDYINTHDICVVWGANATSPFLREIKFSSGDWTCYFQTKSLEAYQSFRKDGLSNNHILPANPEIEKIIRQVRLGDQIELKGKLVDYNMPGALGLRKTSLVRDDVEDGACEVMWVSEARILKTHSKLWYFLRDLCVYGIYFCVILMLFSMFVLPKLQRSNVVLEEVNQRPEEPQ